MWREELTEYLPKIYEERARYAVMFVSRHYAATILVGERSPGWEQDHTMEFAKPAEYVAADQVPEVIERELAFVHAIIRSVDFVYEFQDEADLIHAALICLECYRRSI